jgi:hypothetical protein
MLDTTTHKQPQTTQNQEEKTNRTSFLCENRSRHLNTELRTLRHIIGQHKTLKILATRTPPKTGVNASEIGEHSIVLVELYLTVDIIIFLLLLNMTLDNAC